MVFRTESEFETALITALQNKGWESEVLIRPTEEELIENWARILFNNNRNRDRLDGHPLTKGEMSQIMEQITAHRTPLELNKFINGTSISIKRDNPNDKLHYGKVVSLKIYERMEIAAGQSRYQIVQQPQLKISNKMLGDRRGDLMLLINGMPVIHIELKRSGVPVSRAAYQIKNYTEEGAFTGIFSLIQIFVAMQPEETLYFANPGSDGVFNDNYFFHWADFNNEPINNWAQIAAHLLSIPMAHQLIGFYTVADNSDGILKVMRSYQYYAANAISDRVAKINWDEKNLLGGYIWHTTGSGKTMTSFKSAQLIANSKDADKVLFLMDRIELGTQSLRAYRDFADKREEIHATENTYKLIEKLKSGEAKNTLIVTSIQKMSNIYLEEGGLNAHDIEEMNSKRIVFIVDEAHRSTFGDMLIRIKQTFNRAIFFGFTGTPIHDENQKRKSTTATVFGNELHRYSIADGIRDKNVLGFDPYKVSTFKDKDLREQVALRAANSSNIDEVFDDPKKKEAYYHFMDSSKVKMAGYNSKNGQYIRGIEDYVPTAQYQTDDHRELVVEDILNNWKQLSYNRKFHAIFATSSIVEAIEYYRIFKEKNTVLNITALFDPNIDNSEDASVKREGLCEILSDYNQMFEQDFTIPSHARFKRDLAARLAHKRPYGRLEFTPEKQLDLLIVVDQMLTGYDSKWINTLYLDKVLEYENIIQAFSRTNRLFGPEKRFGTIKYYRYPNTMEKYIQSAVELYSGDKVLGLFVERLEYNLNKMNEIFSDIELLFKSAGIVDFAKLPEDISECGRFAVLFAEFNDYLDAAKIQGFIWSRNIYSFSKPKRKVEMLIDENTYKILVLRYKELPTRDKGDTAVAFDIRGYITEIDTDKIDLDYMNSRFIKYVKQLQQDGADPKELADSLNEVHKSFASLSQEEQKYANLFLNDVRRGDIMLEEGMVISDYITLYQYNAQTNQDRMLSEAFGLDIQKLKEIMSANVTEKNINEYGRLDDLKNTIDREKAKNYFATREGKPSNGIQLSIKIHEMLKNYILQGGFDISGEVEAEVSGIK